MAGNLNGFIFLVFYFIILFFGCCQNSLVMLNASNLHCHYLMLQRNTKMIVHFWLWLLTVLPS